MRMNQAEFQKAKEHINAFVLSMKTDDRRKRKRDSSVKKPDAMELFPHESQEFSLGGLKSSFSMEHFQARLANTPMITGNKSAAEWELWANGQDQSFRKYGGLFLHSAFHRHHPVEQDPFLKQDDAKLLAIARNLGGTRWGICMKIFNGNSGTKSKSAWALLQRYIYLKKKATKRASLEEQHFRPKINLPAVKTGDWDAEDDLKLKLCFRIYGPKWPVIETIVNRNALQCEERFRICLSWSTEEDFYLKSLVEKKISWKLVQQQLSTFFIRTDDFVHSPRDCKERFAIVTNQNKI